MKVGEGGGGGEGRKRLQTNPTIFKTCVRQRTQRPIGSASPTVLICVDQRLVSCNVSCWAQLVSVFLRDVEFSQMVIYRLFC